MNVIFKFKFLILLVLVTAQSFGQQKVVLEHVQVYSAINPSSNYWYPTDIASIEKALDSNLFNELNLTRVALKPTTLEVLTKQSQVGKIVINWDSTRNIPFHAYVELYELDPLSTYENKLVTISNQKKDSIHSIWAVVVDLFNEQHEKVFQKTLMLGMIPVKNIGMGIQANFVATTPYHLFQAITKVIGFVSTDIKELSFMETKVPEAFFTDNYWMPLLHNQQRIVFDTSKQFISFASKKGSQLLRIPPANLIKIDLKNKVPNYQFKKIISDIKNTRKNANSNEYYQVAQALRDVHENKDYSILAYLEFSPDHTIDDNNNGSQALNFLDELGNYIFSGADTIGKFQIKEMEVENTKFYYPNALYNGYDSSKKYVVQTFNKPMQITHSKVISGKLYNHTFKIQFDNDQSLKTILVDEKVVMILDGLNKPRQMVTLPNSLEDSFRNLLILIAYGELFQSPN
jgi:hypothetical protein